MWTSMATKLAVVIATAGILAGAPSVASAATTEAVRPNLPQHLTLVTSDEVKARFAGSYYVSEASGKCLNVAGGSHANGADVVQWACVNAPNNRWYLNEVGNSVWQFRAEHSNKCMNVAGGSSANGADIVQWACVGATNEEFVFAHDGVHANFYIVNVRSGKCVNVKGGSQANGADIVQWDCVDAPNNRWR
jgi:hypothetical protein